MNDEINALVMCECYIVFIVLFHFITCQPMYIVIEDKTNPKRWQINKLPPLPTSPPPPPPPHTPQKKMRLRLVGVLQNQYPFVTCS